MKSIAILSILIFAASLFFSWWIIIIVSFVYMAIYPSSTLWRTIGISFLSGFIVYLAYSLASTLNTERNPAELIANLFGDLPTWSVYIISALIGGITATFGAMSGYFGGKLLRPKI